MKAKDNWFYGILFGLLAILLFLPMAQEHFQLFPTKPLNGVTINTEIPKVNMENYKSSELQKSVEAYIGEHFGFREPVIRLYNQYIWDFFRKTYVESLVVGKDKWLYGKEFTDDYIGQRLYEYVKSPEQLHERLLREAERIRKVQEILAEYDKHLFVIMEPGKARTYPEHLPDRILSEAANHPEALCAADIYPTIFDSLGVNYINFDRWFIDNKNKVGYQLYPQTGTHWSNLAALHATDSIIRYMEHVGQRNLKNLEISDKVYNTTMKPDDDFELLLNVLRTVRDIPNQYAQFTVEEDTTAVLPIWIHIGDSYYWNISYHVPLDKIFKLHPYWYYNSTIFYDPQHHSTGETDVLLELIRADYITLGYCTSQLYALSSYFSSKALVRLCYGQREINRVIDQIVESMNNTPEWKASLQQKAEQQGKPLEAVMRSDAVYLLYVNPEHYLPALQEKHPTPRNPMLAMAQPDNPIGAVLRNMINNPEWMEGLRKKAVEKQLDLETVMLQDAQWMLNQP